MFRLFPKDTYLNGQHVAHEPSIFQVVTRRRAFLPQILLAATIVFAIVVYATMILILLYVPK